MKQPISSLPLLLLWCLCPGLVHVSTHKQFSCTWLQQANSNTLPLTVGQRQRSLTKTTGGTCSSSGLLPQNDVTVWPFSLSCSSSALPLLSPLLPPLSVLTPFFYCYCVSGEIVVLQVVGLMLLNTRNTIISLYLLMQCHRQYNTGINSDAKNKTMQLFLDLLSKTAFRLNMETCKNMLQVQ